MRAASKEKKRGGNRSRTKDVEANEAFREILRREMAKRPELSQNAFAKLIGTNSAYLSEILAGKKDGQRLAVQLRSNKKYDTGRRLSIMIPGHLQRVAHFFANKCSHHDISA